MEQMTSGIVRDLMLVSLGALFGFASSVAVVWIQRRNQRREQSDRIKKLAVRLVEEVEQAAELIDVDLRIGNPTPLELLLGDDPGLLVRLQSALKRLRGCRTIYDACAGDLIYLPTSAAMGLARFHNRLSVQCGEMEVALAKGDFTAFKDTAQLALIEAESVKHDIRSG